MTTQHWLAETKLYPPVMRGAIIPRGRLEERLLDAIERHGLTLLSAPAGYGKTTLLAGLDRRLPTAWLALDEEDNDPVRFMLGLTAALRRIHPSLGHAVDQALAGGPLRRAVSLLVNELIALETDPFVLVLDDLNLVGKPTVYQLLEYLVERMPAPMRLVVGTRQDPPLPLAKLAARGQLTEIRRPALSFTAEEAAALLNGARGLALPEAELALLQQRTEGWPAGLVLLAGSLEQVDSPAGRTAFLQAMAQTDRYIFDFLAHEVLARQPEPIRRFLLESSILPELTPALCQAVTGRPDADEMLEELSRRNLFLSATADAYRYHALFAAFLQKQLKREQPDRLAELHGRAAGAQADPLRQMAHLLAGELWAEAATAMEERGTDLLYQGFGETIRLWYEALPAAVRDARPRLSLLMGACFLHRGRFAEAERLLAAARDSFAAAGDGAGEGAALSSMISAAALQNDLLRARSIAEGARALPVPPPGRVQLQAIRAWGSLIDGDWAAAAAHLAEALGTAQGSGDPTAVSLAVSYTGPIFAPVPGCLAAIERFGLATRAEGLPEAVRLALEEQWAFFRLWRGDLEQAAALAEGVLAAMERLGDHGFLGHDARIYLALVLMARGDLAGAERQVERLRPHLEGMPNVHTPLWLQAAGRLAWLAGRTAEAEAMAARLEGLADPLGVSPIGALSLRGLLALGQGRWGEAEAALREAVIRAEERPVARSAGEPRLLLARLCWERGRREEALGLLQAVLAEGVPGPVLIEGRIALPVLQGAGAEPILRLMGEGPGPASAPTSLAEPLTQREEEVLRQIIAGAANKEIAAALFISEETVKTHVARVLRKLEVTSRARAAARGRELGFGG